VDDSVNGLPAVKCDNAQISTAFPFPEIKEGTIYLVAKQLAGGGSYGYFISAGDNFHLGRNELLAPNVIGGQCGSGSPMEYAYQEADNDRYYTIRLRVSEDKYYLSLNGGDETEHDKTPGFVVTPGLLAVGKYNDPAEASSSNCYIAEILIYTTDHPVAKRNQVEDYLKEKYNHY
jgi:hypothetical protein